MVHTNLFTNEIYLILTSIISLGVLGGIAYFNIVLAMLLVMPVIKLRE